MFGGGQSDWWGAMAPQAFMVATALSMYNVLIFRK